MQKIPTVFERDWDGDRSRVVDKISNGCEWWLQGEGVARQKIDGACCAVIDGVLWKRREIKKGKAEPGGFKLIGTDDTTGKRVGWAPVGDGPEDVYFIEAWNAFDGPRDEGSYELIGPKVQGNLEHEETHRLVSHADTYVFAGKDAPPRSFAGVQEWFEDRDIEGVVWHHPDGRMCKLKLRDFGLKRPG